MPAFDPERFEKLLACKRAAMEYLSHCPPKELDEAERLLCVEVANCAEVFRRRGRVPADGDPLDVDYLDCPPRDGGAVYCP